MLIISMAAGAANWHEAYAEQGTSQAVTTNLNITAGSLASAITEFAAQTGINITVEPALVQGRQTPGLQGVYSVLQGLSSLLAPLGLQAEEEQQDNFIIRVIPERQVERGSVAVLPELAVSVSGKAPGSTTEGTGSYTTWSTSSSTRLNLTPQETPQAVTVMTRQRMDDQKLDTLVDVLDATPGLIVQYSTYGQDGPSVYARGSLLRNYQVDGVPVFNTMSPFLANMAAFDRVEIVRGATGIMNGLGTPAATINMIRKRPTSEPQMVLTAEGGSWSRHGAGVDISGALNADKSLRGRLVADYKDQDAWVDRYNQKSIALYGIVELDLGLDTLLTAGISHLSVKTDSAIQGRPLYFNDGTRTSLSPSDNISQRWRYYDHDTSSIFTSIEHRFAPGWVGKAEYTHTRYEYDGMVGSFWAAADASGAGSRIYASHWNSKPKQDNLDAYITGAFELFGRTHELIAGVTMSRLRADGPSYTRDPSYSIFINYYDWAEAPEPTFTKTGSSYERQRQENAFLSTRLGVTDATSVLLGGRLTHWELDGGDNTGFAYKQKENVFVPYAGIVHAINDTWSVYGSYTKIFRPQDYSIFDLVNSSSRPDPEEGESYEAGIKGSFYEGRLTSSMSLFQTKLKNLAIWNIDTYFYDIQGLTKTRGVELELSGELAKNWQLTAGYAFARSKDENDQSVLTYVPRQSLKLFTTYRLPGEWNKMTVGGGVNWQGAMHSGNDIDYRQGGVALVNLMARYEVSNNLSVSLNLNNALDKEYYSTVAGNFGTFGAPRNFMASMKYTF
ncbi:TonB-dependent receptor [Methylobacillus arboreus]|uniref:TonB-dependent siderophore receptor n=1 Tax=Methylobacillus arboreus TaxID=755170 RepID=UPI001E397E91|nr:TonB-dependent receptor [Methylobacillus arboreus]MCB5189477.1 TonB-dependent receptor [Methylobacillus arboreus]